MCWSPVGGREEQHLGLTAQASVTSDDTVSSEMRAMVGVSLFDGPEVGSAEAAVGLCFDVGKGSLERGELGGLLDRDLAEGVTVAFDRPKDGVDNGDKRSIASEVGKCGALVFIPGVDFVGHVVP
jgi:hypothetical protein